MPPPKEASWEIHVLMLHLCLANKKKASVHIHHKRTLCRLGKKVNISSCKGIRLLACHEEVRVCVWLANVALVTQVPVEAAGQQAEKQAAWWEGKSTLTQRVTSFLSWIQEHTLTGTGVTLGPS